MVLSQTGVNIRPLARRARTRLRHLREADDLRATSWIGHIAIEPGFGPGGAQHLQTPRFDEHEILTDAPYSA